MFNINDHNFVKTQETGKRLRMKHVLLLETNLNT